MEDGRVVGDVDGYLTDGDVDVRFAVGDVCVVLDDGIGDVRAVVDAVYDDVRIVDDGGDVRVSCVIIFLTPGLDVVVASCCSPRDNVLVGRNPARRGLCRLCNLRLGDVVW